MSDHFDVNGFVADILGSQVHIKWGICLKPFRCKLLKEPTELFHPKQNFKDSVAALTDLTDQEQDEVLSFCLYWGWWWSWPHDNDDENNGDDGDVKEHDNPGEGDHGHGHGQGRAYLEQLWVSTFWHLQWWSPTEMATCTSSGTVASLLWRQTALWMAASPGLGGRTTGWPPATGPWQSLWRWSSSSYASQKDHKIRYMYKYLNL